MTDSFFVVYFILTPHHKVGNAILLCIFFVLYIQYEGELESLDDDSSSNRFRCPQCSSTFSFKQGLNWHWKGVHGNSLKTLVDPTCNKKVKVSSESKPPRFKCPLEE